MVLRLSNATWYYTSSITNVLRHHLTKNIKDSTIGAMTANFEMVEEYQKIIVKHQYGLKTTNITTKTNKQTTKTGKHKLSQESKKG